MRRLLAALGWQDHSAPDRALPSGAVFGLCHDSHSVLTFPGCRRGADARPTPEGRLFARAALQNRPGRAERHPLDPDRPDTVVTLSVGRGVTAGSVGRGAP